MDKNLLALLVRSGFLSGAIGKLSILRPGEGHLILGIWDCLFLDWKHISIQANKDRRCSIQVGEKGKGKEKMPLFKII